MLPVQTQGVTRSDAAITTRDLNQILQPNAEQSARVVNSRQDPVSPTLFRVALEVGNQRLEVMTNRPLAEGLTVLLSRDSRGDLALRLPTPVQSQPTPAQIQALSQLNGQSNQFIAMIAPESRGQAQQILTQTQMTALVQPQISNPTPPATPLTNRTQSGQTAAAQPNPTGAARGAPAANSGQSNNSQTSTATLASGSAAAQSAAANSTPIEAIRGLVGNSGQSQQGQAGGQTQAQAQAQAGAQNQAQGQAPAQTQVQTQAPAQIQVQPQAQPPIGQGTGQSAPSNPAPSNPAPSTSTSSASNPVTSQPQSGPQSTTPAQPAKPSPINQPGQGATTPTSQPAPPQVQPQAQLPTQQQPAPNTQTAISLARVIEGINPQATPPTFARVTLNVGGETLNLVTPRPILAGQQVEVTRLNEMAVQIRILPAQPVKSMPAEVVEEMQALLRQAMPIQAPLADSLNQMRALNSAKGQDAVGQIVRSLMGLFSLAPQTNSDARAKQVEQMMQQSGLFTENRMARQAGGQPLSVDDLRTRLGQLRKAAQELPTAARDQLNALIDKAEARTTHQQIQSARQWRDYPDGSAERYFRMELPLQTPEGFKQVELELKEQRRPITPAEMQINWTLNLHFDLDPIGAVDARAHLEQEWDLSISFWAESLRTTEMIRDQLDGFSSHLQQQGFEIESINVRKGRAPNDLAPAVSKNLVDLHT